MHMLVQMTLAPERLASASAVAIWRAPCEQQRDEGQEVPSVRAKGEEGRTVQPSGWPRAMAPPFGLTLA